MHAQAIRTIARIISSTLCMAEPASLPRHLLRRTLVKWQSSRISSVWRPGSCSPNLTFAFAVAQLPLTFPPASRM
jgi:hypothetical protein